MKRELAVGMSVGAGMLMGTRVTLSGQVLSTFLVSSEASGEEPQDATDGVNLNGVNLNGVDQNGVDPNWRYPSL